MLLIIKIICQHESCEKVGFATISRLICFVEKTPHSEWAGKKLSNAARRKCEDRDRWRDAIHRSCGVPTVNLTTGCDWMGRDGTGREASGRDGME